MFQFCLWINILRQRVLTAWLKDSRQVKSLLKKGAHCFEGEQKDLFGKKFQKKLNESKKSIRKQYSSWKNVQDTHRLNALIIMDHVSHPFDKVPIPVDLDGGIDPTKIKGSCQELAKENFTLVEEEVPGDISIQPKSKMKQANTKGNICAFWMGGFPVRIPLSVVWSWFGPMVIYKIHESASLHSSQSVYKNNIYLDDFLIVGNTSRKQS